MTTNEKISQLIKEKFNIKSDINGEFRYLDSANFDSFGLIQFIMEIEEEFDINLTPEDTQSDEFRYIDGLVKIIENKENE